MFFAACQNAHQTHYHHQNCAVHSLHLRLCCCCVCLLLCWPPQVASHLSRGTLLENYTNVLAVILRLRQVSEREGGDVTAIVSFCCGVCVLRGCELRWQSYLGCRMPKGVGQRCNHQVFWLK